MAKTYLFLYNETINRQKEKPNQVEQFKIPKERISKFFPTGTPAKKMEETIVKALELYRRRQRDRER